MGTCIGVESAARYQVRSKVVGQARVKIGGLCISATRTSSTIFFSRTITCKDPEEWILFVDDLRGRANVTVQRRHGPWLSLQAPNLTCSSDLQPSSLACLQYPGHHLLNHYLPSTALGARNRASRDALSPLIPATSLRRLQSNRT